MVPMIDHVVLLLIVVVLALPIGTMSYDEESE